MKKITKIYIILMLAISLVLVACPTETSSVKKVEIITEGGKRQIAKENGSTIDIEFKYDLKKGEEIKYNINNIVDKDSTTYSTPFSVSEKSLINVAVFKKGNVIPGTENSLQVYKIRYKFDTKAELINFLNKEIPIRGLEGDYNDIGLGAIEDLSKLFSPFGPIKDVKDFNGDISAWDTSKVTNMSEMFNEAEGFNQPLYFNTSKVENMSKMFCRAKKFNQPVNFDTSSVTDMHMMFAGAKMFNQPLNFNTSNVTNMSNMFGNATNFNQTLNFNTSNVKDMSKMFYNAKSFNQTLNFNTSNVTNMYGMFYGAKSFNQDLSEWEPKSVTNMNYMFAYSVYSKSLLAWEDDLLDTVSHKDFNTGTPTLTNDMLPSQLK